MRSCWGQDFLSTDEEFLYFFDLSTWKTLQGQNFVALHFTDHSTIKKEGLLKVCSVKVTSCVALNYTASFILIGRFREACSCGGSDAAWSRKVRWIRVPVSACLSLLSSVIRSASLRLRVSWYWSSTLWASPRSTEHRSRVSSACSRHTLNTTVTTHTHLHYYYLFVADYLSFANY